MTQAHAPRPTHLPAVRRLLVVLTCAALAVVLAPALPAVAAPATTTGQVVTVENGRGLPGQTVRLRTLDRAGLGTIVDTDVTGPGGAFDLTGVAGNKYFVELVAGRYQPGVAGGRPRYFKKGAFNGGKLYPAGARLGEIYATPATSSGKVVDFDTKEPLAGVVVSALRKGSSGPTVADVTDSNGSFELKGLRFTDGFLRVDGSPVGRESGVMGCSKHVVPADSQACRIATGRIGTPIKIETVNTQPGPVTRASRLAGGRPIRFGQVGKTKAGMTVAAAAATGEFDQDVQNPPCDPIRLRPTGVWKDRYVVFVNGADRISEMEVLGRRPRTLEGLGVGSTNAQVEAVYGSELSAPMNVGYLQWGRYVSQGTGAERRWIGFLFGDALVADGPLTSSDKVTLVGVRKRFKPGLMIDGC